MLEIITNSSNSCNCDTSCGRSADALRDAHLKLMNVQSGSLHACRLIETRPRNVHVVQDTVRNLITSVAIEERIKLRGTRDARSRDRIIESYDRRDFFADCAVTAHARAGVLQHAESVVFYAHQRDGMRGVITGLKPPRTTKGTHDNDAGAAQRRGHQPADNGQIIFDTTKPPRKANPYTDKSGTRPLDRRYE